MEIANAIPFKEILQNPNSAWAIAFIILLIYVMYQNGKREDKLMEIVNGTLKDITAAVTNLCGDIKDVKADIEELKRGEG